MLNRKKINVTLVWPDGFLPSYSIPLAFALLKSNSDPDRFNFSIINCVLDKINAKSPAFADKIRAQSPDIVGVSSWSPMFPEAIEILKIAKQIDPKITTVIGGAHATSYSEKVMQFPEVDFLFRGEADRSFNIFLGQWTKAKPDWSIVNGLTYRNGSETVSNKMERTDPLDDIAAPDYSFIDLDAYQKSGYRWNSPPVPNAPLWITRGCPYRCQYCSAPYLNGRLVRKHSIDYMIKLIKNLYENHNTRWFNIIDDNFTFEKEYAKDFCRAVIKLNLEDAGFGTPNGIRMARGDAELWSLMKQAGWRHLIVAPESGSKSTLRLMKKGLKLEVVPKIVKEIRRAGLKVQAFFIVGYPGEKPEDLEATAKLIRDCKFNFVFLANFHPLPGTPVYNTLIKQGEIEDGLLPHNFSDGTRSYTPKEFQGYNFSKFILKIHFMMMITNPTNIPYHLSVLFKLYKPKVVINKFLMNFLAMINVKKSHEQGRIFKPMHEQAQNAVETS